MHTGINTCAATDAEVVVDGNMVARSVVAHLNGADTDATMAVTAFLWIDINHGPEMFRI